jgi:hypothetical protein
MVRQFLCGILARLFPVLPGIPGCLISENKNIVEMHGCIVCARLFNDLMYTPDTVVVDYTVTGPGANVPDEHQSRVACNTHTAEEIESAHNKWQSWNIKESDDEQDNG